MTQRRGNLGSPESGAGDENVSTTSTSWQLLVVFGASSTLWSDSELLMQVDNLNKAAFVDHVHQKMERLSL